MAVSVTTNSIPYTGDGSTTGFSIPFKWLDNADLSVVYTPSGGAPVDWVVGADYTLVGVGVDVGGTLTATTAPATGSALVITRNTPPKQPLSLPAQGPFPAASIEGALDRVTLVQQDTLNDATDLVDTLSARVTDDEADISTNTSAISSLTTRTTAVETYLDSLSGGDFTAFENALDALDTEFDSALDIVNRSAALSAAMTLNDSVLPFSPACGCATNFAGGAVTNPPMAIVFGGSAGEIYSGPFFGANGLTSRTGNLGSGIVHSIDSSGSLLVAGAAGGHLATSADGKTWTSRTSGSSQDIRAVKYSSRLGLWVDVAENDHFFSSTDGTTWTPRTAVVMRLDVIIEGNGVLVAIPAGAASLVYYTSTDGITWTSRTLPGLSPAINKITNGYFSDALSLFFYVDAAGKVYKSSNGIAWTLVLTPPIAEWGAIGGAGKAVVMVTASTAFYTTTDGTTWAQQTPTMSGNTFQGVGQIFKSPSNSLYYLSTAASPNSFVTPAVLTAT